MTALTPPDVLQCQTDIPNGENSFTLGGGHKMVRCTNAAAFIVTEVEPGADGQCGSMSVCDECKAVLIEQMGPSIDKLAIVHIESPIAFDTIELFPGVKFRKDTTKPLGNQWLFEHDGQWLIAKLAYSDDLTLDHVAKVTRERDALAVRAQDCTKLATAIAEAGVECGHVSPGHSLSGPQLLMILGDMVTILKLGQEQFKDAERYRWMRDCPWVGHMQAVGITALGDDTKWLSGADADRAIDAEMTPAPVTLSTPPLPFLNRICHKPDCWYCEGSGWQNGAPCEGDDHPF